MLLFREDLTSQQSRSGCMATLSYRDFVLCREAFAALVLGCKEQTLVLVTFHKVEIYQQGVGSSKIEAEALRVTLPGGKGSPPFQFSAFFPSEFIFQGGAPGRREALGTLTDGTTVAGGKGFVAKAPRDVGP